MNSKTFDEFIDCICACISDEFVYKIGPYRKRIACYKNCLKLAYQCIALDQGLGIRTAIAIGEFESNRLTEKSIYDGLCFLEECELDD